MWIALLPMLASPPKIELAQPFIVKAAGQPIKLDIGHSAPILADYDGDHLPDLLVGQFGQGQMRIYKNVGTRENPKFDKFEWFKADGKIAQVEAG